MTISIVAFYKFVFINDPEALQRQFEDALRPLGMMGTLLIAHEGINGTLSAEPDAMEVLLALLRGDARFCDTSMRRSQAPKHPFKRLKIKIKREIVGLGHPDCNPLNGGGTYVAPQDWNDLIDQPDVVVIDSRNTYEVGLGTFERAINPGTRSFNEFPRFVAQHLDPSKHKRVAMFCTGGIRCEKASALMVALGFREVFQLQGGILNYLETVASERSRWRGGCFVFDERVALTHGLAPVTALLSCDLCGQPRPDGQPCCPPGN